MKILTVNGAWSERNQSSGWMMWLLISLELDCKKNRLITKLVLLTLLENWVETYLLLEDKQRLKEFTISSKMLL